MNNYSLKERELIKDLQAAKTVWINPDFINQSAESMNVEQRRIWFADCLIGMENKGVTFVQQSVDDVDNPKLCLVEGWLVNPKDLSAFPTLPQFQKEEII